MPFTCFAFEGGCNNNDGVRPLSAAETICFFAVPTWFAQAMPSCLKQHQGPGDGAFKNRRVRFSDDQRELSWERGAPKLGGEQVFFFVCVEILLGLLRDIG